MKESHMRRSLLTAGLVILALAAAATPSQAGSNVVYGPSHCTSAFNGRDWENPSFFVGPSGFYFKESPAEAICPIVRQNIHNLNGLRAVSIYVHVGPGARVFCSAYAIDLWGRILEVNTKDVQTEGNQQIDLSTSVSGDYGSYAIGCTLPPTSYLINYVVLEW
jgi:hypothetical protein